jgi:hypothetical protein
VGKTISYDKLPTEFFQGLLDKTLKSFLELGKKLKK